jgi:hypothetical protein
MILDRPTLPELLRTVREFIDSVTTSVPDKDRYHALCASYLLAVAEREVSTPAALDEAERQALERFMGETGSLTDLYDRFAIQLRDGRYDDRWDAALELILAQVIQKIRVSKPEYLHPMHREDTT